MNTTQKYTSDIKDVDNMTGLDFEEFCCELLKQNGYINVKKTQASGDYGLDVIATSKDGFVCGIQCKNYQGSVGVAAVQEANTGSQYYKCDIAIVLTNSTFTKQAVEMASKINVKLWDRNRLKELIQVFPPKVADNFGHGNSSDRITVDNITDKDFYWFCENLLKKYYGYTDIAQREINREREYYFTAVKNNLRYLILCKRSDNLIFQQTITQAVLRENKFGCQASIILTNNFFAETAIETAKKLNVQLWDRDKITKVPKQISRK